MRPAIHSSHKGFTLVEAIVAGALSIFVLLSAIALYKMNTDQISGNFVRSLTRRQYQTVIDQIGKDVRNAISIASRLPDTGSLLTQSDSIILFDTTGVIFAKYKRSANSLLEWKNAQYASFKVGNKNVQVLDVGTDNTFTISSNRRSVLLNLTVFGVDGTSNDTMYSGKERFTCRIY